ncbi:DUF2000 domain-containing protein [Microbispora sp. RL4-1S]|uniref:DUF2000 domain-containing protein n=1 Tax=Microbispora oryzae TaxID=2806554 RepID=A0A941AL25_9ACTN|nr:DUF2000 domain-containing protein [Microbispora oryzae]MBP2705868.1 DUF2000 domain-containing protein [Microbispora oryzae]
MYADNSKKFVAVLNKRFPVPVLMNALGHLASGLGGIVPSSETEFLEYPCPAGDFVSSISRYPFIVLRSDNGNQLRTLAAAAGEQGLPRNVFTETMLGSSAEDQINATKNASAEELEYIGVLVFGDAEVLQPLTKKFSVFK